MPTYSLAGLLVDEVGTLQTSVGPTHNYVNGIPVDIDGNVVVTTTAPVATDPYLAGQRISNAEHALCIIDETPPATGAWSDGYSDGFGP